MINYKLRDWLFSRQRYWGEPFPIVWDEGGHVGLSENDLPLTPPNLTDFKPTGAGDPPLACAEEWCQAGEGHYARDEHHAAMGRQLLVLPALYRCTKQRLLCCRRSGALLDGLG